MNSIPINELVPLPFLAVITSLLISFGLIYLSFILFRGYFRTKPGYQELFGIFLILLGFINSCIYLGTQFQLLNLPLIRSIGISLMLLGLFGFVKLIIYYNFNLPGKYSSFKALSINLKLAILVLFLLLIAFFLLAVSPLTDSDSLYYHSGYPVSYLFYGYKLPMNDWIHTRLIGIGESFNFIGLSTWTDHLSSTIQITLLIILVLIFLQYLKSRNSPITFKIFTCSLLFGVPVLLFLIPNQKSELLGHLSILGALSISTLNEKQTNRSLFLSIGALFLAFSIKYSFYVSGFFPLFFIGYIAYKNKLLKYFVCYSLLFYFLMIFPHHLINYLHYGNPVSPMFSQLFNEKGGSDLASFEKYLKNYADFGFQFPLGLLIPKSLGSFQTVLGLGLFTFLFLDYKKRRTTELIILAILTLLISILFVQRTSRFLLDSYYIVLLAFIVNPVKTKGFGAFSKLVLIQSVLVTISAIVGVLLLFPGSLTQVYREKTLLNHADNYNLMEYINKVLPDKSIMISDFRNTVYNPRNFIGKDYPFMMKYYPEEFRDRIKKLTNFECFYIADHQLDNSNILFDAIPTKEPYFKPENFSYSTRNPFNRNRLGNFYQAYIYKVDLRTLEETAKSHL